MILLRLFTTKLDGWRAVVRDTFMFILVAIAGYLAVPFVFGPNPQRYVLAIFNVLLGVIVFCVSGCMIAEKRWRHLNKLALTIWLIISSIAVITVLIPFRYELLNIYIAYIIVNLLVSIIAVYIMMALGGGLSFVFVKSGKKDGNITNKQL